MTDGDGGGFAQGPGPAGDPGVLLDTTPFDPRTTPARSATQLAGWLPPRSAVPWAALEIAALTRHPDIQDLLDPRRRWPRGADPTPYVLLLCLSLGAMLLVVLGISVLTSSELDGHPSATAAGGLGAALVGGASVLLLLRLVLWWMARARRRRAPGLDLGLGAVTLGFVVVGVLAAPGRLGGAFAAQLTAVSIAAAVVTALVVVSPVAAWRLVPPEPRRGGSTPAYAPEDARRAIGDLGPGQQAAIRTDLDRAIDLLVRRRLLPTGVADRARGAALGALATEMSRRARRSSA